MGPVYEKSKVNSLSQEELAILLAYNEILYKVAKGILAGHFGNPYTENGRNIAPYVDQFKAIAPALTNHTPRPSQTVR